MMLRRYHKKQTKELPETKGFAIPIESVKPRSIVELTVKELKELCKERGLKGYSNKSEAELIEMLQGGEA